MELNQDDKDRIIKWLTEKCASMRCFCCGMSKFDLLPLATLPIVYDLHSTRVHYSQGIPQVSLLCLNCGYTLFFNPAVMGFKPDEPKPVPVDEKK